MLSFGGLLIQEKRTVFVLRYRYRQHRGMTQFRLIPVVSHLYISGKVVVLREILVGRHNILVQHLKRHFLVSQKTV